MPIAALPDWIRMLAQPTTGHGFSQTQVDPSSQVESIFPQLDLTKVSLISPLIREVTGENHDQHLIEAPLDREFLATLYKDPKIAWLCLGALGISASRTGEKFLCPIHPEKRPSASVYVDGKRGGLTIWCWHQRRAYTIPEVRAAQVSGEIRWLRGPSTFIWGLRVLLEAHVVPPAPVPYRPLPASLPVTAPAAVRTVYAGFILLLQCRWLSEPSQPAPYSRGFAEQWCGVSEFHAEKAIHWLHDHGYIVKASGYAKPLERHGETPRITTLYLPAENSMAHRT